MPADDFPEPRPTPLEWFSPTTVNELLRCQLAVAFRRDPRYRQWSRPTTFSALGRIAHDVVQAAPSALVAAVDPRRALEELWTQQEALHARELDAAWAPAQPPPPSEWPGYQLTRTRTIRRLLGPGPAAPRRAPAHAVTAALAVTPSAVTEVELEDEATGLRGRVDRIERSDGEVRIVDVKTGLQQGEPTDDQRRQVLLYAVLVHSVEGRWPSAVAIEHSSGHRTTEPLEPAAASAALAEATDAVHRFNTAISERRTFAAMAAPDAERCRHCAFRPLCGPYWRSLLTSWDHHAVLGRVGDATATPHGWSAMLGVTSPGDVAGTALHVARLQGEPPEHGQMVAVVGFWGSLLSGRVSGTWSTVVRRI